MRFPGVSGSALLAATPEVAVGSVRLTLGRATTEADVDRAAAALASAWARLRG